VAVRALARALAHPADRYDGESATAIAHRLGLSNVHLYATIGSTMDTAHTLGEAGAPAGTLVLANAQTSGRGRKGNAWRSPPGRGVWLTLLERPAHASGLEVLSLRMGLAAARALDAFAADRVRVKWPNDLFVAGGKLAGVLVEVRWRGGRPDWVALGLGVNVRPPPDVPSAAGLRDGTVRLDVLASLLPGLRHAVAQKGPLDPHELTDFAERDFARGRRCVSPARGVVDGLSGAGELVVRTASGIARYRAGSLVLEEGA
jgi:BirA family biotin operon repressor/biotin-[acetyl-CoA-carboxylase] ligase